MGVKINTKPLVNIQDGDNIPIDRSGADFRVQPDSWPSYLLGKGFLKGDPTYPYIEDQSTNRKWQLGQKAIQLPTSTSPNIATPDLDQSNMFNFQPSGTEFELQLPTNAPAIAELGIGASATMYFVIYSRNASDGSAGGLTFGSDYIELPGSKPYLKDGTNRVNIIHCWYSVTGKVYYRVDNEGYANGQLIPLEFTIPSAQVLTSNGTPVEIIAAPGAGKFINVERICAALVNGSSVYTVNTSAYIQIGNTLEKVVDIDLGNTNINRGPILGELTGGLDLWTNANMNFITSGGNPSTGDYDLKIWGTYRILDA